MAGHGLDSEDCDAKGKEDSAIIVDVLVTQNKTCNKKIRDSYLSSNDTLSDGGK